MSNHNNQNQCIVVYLSERGCLAYVEAILKELSSKQPHLLLSQKNLSRFESSYSAEDIRTTKNKIQFLWSSLSIQMQARKRIDDWTNRYGSITLYFPAFHPWNLAFLKMAKEKGITTTLTIHDYHTHSGEKSTLIESQQKKMIGLATEVIFLSEYVKAQAEAELGPQAKFAVHPHPILDAGLRHALGHSTQPAILFLGRVVHYKGVDLLMKAVQDLKINKLTIAGEQVGLSIKSTDGVEVIDHYLSPQEMSELIATHHLLVLPYREASQSGILTLGLSAGIPIIATRVGGLTEQAGAEQVIWTDPSIQGIRHAVRAWMGV